MDQEILISALEDSLGYCRTVRSDIMDEKNQKEQELKDVDSKMERIKKQLLILKNQEIQMLTNKNQSI